jgi:hypothetical protein
VAHPHRNHGSPPSGTPAPIERNIHQGEIVASFTRPEDLDLFARAPAALRILTTALAEDVASIRAAITDLANQIRALVDEVERRSVPPGSCSLGWGICPDHGATLVTSRGRSRCTVCDASWDYDRENQHCREPAAFLFGASPACRAHASAAPDRSQIAPIDRRCPS